MESVHILTWDKALIAVAERSVTTQALDVRVKIKPASPLTWRCLILTLSWTKTRRRNWIHNQTDFLSSDVTGDGTLQTS